MCVQVTLIIDGVETTKNFGYDIQLIRPDTHVYLGGSDEDTEYIRQQREFRGIIQKVSREFRILWRGAKPAL